MNNPKKDIALGLVIYLLDILLFYFLWKNNIVLSLSLLLISGFLLWKSDSQEKFAYVASFILGPIIDVLLVPTGIWVYGNKTSLQIPLWLPFAYGIFGLLLMKISKAIAKIY